MSQYFVTEIKKTKSRNLKGQRVMMATCREFVDGKVVHAWNHMTAYNLIRGTRAKAARQYLTVRLNQHIRIDHFQNFP